MSNRLGAVPRWDLTPVFPGLESPAFVQTFESVATEIDALTGRFDAARIRRRATPGIDAEFVAIYEEVATRLNALYRTLETLYSYIGCFTTTDALNDTAQRYESELSVNMVPLDQLMTRYIAWIGSSDIEALIAASEVAQAHAFPLRRARQLAERQMAEAEEALTSELRPSSITAWAKLHTNVTSLLEVSLTRNGETETLPMSQIRALANDPDRETRKAAFEAEIAAWKTVEVPLAAALNGVKGFQTTVRKKRGYADDVEPTLLYNNMDAATLAAMQQACEEAFPDLRRYMQAKARLLGQDKMTWYDLSAPVGASDRAYAWSEAEEVILTNFGRYSEKMAEFAEKTFRESWIDAEPRVGKEGGAYCTGILPGVSRILMNYDGSFNSIGTLAHELGHAYHNLNLTERLPLQSETPATLAETASIFCETIVFEALLARATPEERLSLLDTTLQRDLQVVVDIHSRFLFEQSVFARRAARDLTVAEFNELMTQAQRATYGEAIEPTHPYMWAVKGHYYGPTFYNYPYTFGLLFALGLYAFYLQNPETFRAKYDAFLSATGLADAATLAAEFGVDITKVEFWRSSLDLIRKNIAEFERLV